MAGKLNIPSVISLGITDHGLVVFLQAVQDALNTLDRNALYKDTVNVNVPAPRLRALSAQGQAFTVDGTNLASGDDYVTLVRDTKIILEELITLRQTVDDLVRQMRGE